MILLDKKLMVKNSRKITYLKSFFENFGKTLENLAEDHYRFAEKTGELFAKRLISGIENTDIVPGSSKWKSLSKGYIELKKEKGFESGFWKRTGALKRSLGIHKKGKGYVVVGINPQAQSVEMDLSGKITGQIKTTWVVNTMEFGRYKLPPRPLFRPLQHQFITSEFPTILKGLKKSLRKSFTNTLKSTKGRVTPPSVNDFAQEIISFVNTITQKGVN